MPEESVIQIDEERQIVLRLIDDDTIVLVVEDPQNIAIIEMHKSDVVALYEALEDWLKA